MKVDDDETGEDSEDGNEDDWGSDADDIVPLIDLVKVSDDSQASKAEW